MSIEELCVRMPSPEDGWANLLPRLTRAQIEEIERKHFPHLFEVCHTPVVPKPPLLQALWANCLD